MGQTRQLCEKCQHNKPEKNLSLCYQCSHCDSCDKYTEAKKDGLCTDCRSTLLSQARENFRAVIERLDFIEIPSGIVITIKFYKDIDTVRRALERKDLKEKYQEKGFFSKLGAPNNRNPQFSESFSVLSTVLSKISSNQNRVKITVESSYFRRFGKMISGGHYDYLQGNDTGYSVHVVAEHDDSCTIPIVAKTLRRMSFGCHVSNMTIDGFLRSDAPNAEGEVQLINRVKAALKIELGPNS